MKTYKNPTPDEINTIVTRPVFESAELEKTVREILDLVMANGDDSLKELTLKFDGFFPDILKLSHYEIEKAENQISNDLKEAIDVAYKNILKFHESQKIKTEVIETTPGVKCYRKPVAIEKVGLYIPGGTAPLFSTVLMLGIPAMIAGCKEVVLCTPCDSDGRVNPAILYSARLCGITGIFRIGGAQAIAAMAYGTESVPKVYKIFGPGNQYVTMAKMLAYLQGIAIDMPAGPSEVMVVADESANPAFVAADLLSQAEHGKDSQVVLLTSSEEILEQTLIEVEKQTKLLPKKEIVMESLKNSCAVLITERQKMIELMNQYAPEHLILSVKDTDFWVENVINAGSVFIGNYTPESAGDYASGTNHTLPTNGFSKAWSGLSLDDFVKKITFQEITREGLKNLQKTIETMAENEGLTAHRNAVTIRLP